MLGIDEPFEGLIWRRGAIEHDTSFPGHAQAVFGVIAGGSSARRAALRFEVSASAAIKLMQRLGETGSTAAPKIGGYRPPILEGQADYLCELTETNKGITLGEIQAKLKPAASRSLLTEMKRGEARKPK